MRLKRDADGIWRWLSMEEYLVEQVEVRIGCTASRIHAWLTRACHRSSSILRNARVAACKGAAKS